MTVISVEFVHRACITASCLIPRRPLTSTARRAGWQGVVFDLDRIPATARVEAVTNGVFLSLENIEAQWAAADRLLRQRPHTRGWTADILRVVEQLPDQFRLTEVYAFDEEFAARHPENFNVRPKIRQQLQVLRDLGFIAFRAPGAYQKIQIEGHDVATRDHP